jgi:hypothetical protein
MNVHFRVRGSPIVYAYKYSLPGERMADASWIPVDTEMLGNCEPEFLRIQG